MGTFPYIAPEQYLRQRNDLRSDLFAAEAGYLDNLALNKVSEFEDGLLTFVRAHHKTLLDEINATGDYDDSIKNNIKSAIDIYCSTL